MKTSFVHAVRLGVVALACVIACTQALAQPAGEPAVTRRATELRESPGDTGRAVASLPAQAPLTRLGERQGPWVQVRSAAGATGWLHMFDVGPASGDTQASGGGSGVLRGVTGFLGGSQQRATTSTSAIGIRGLGAEDIARAQPNLPAVGQMESMRQSEADARAFADKAALHSAAVDPLPAPRTRAGGGSSDPSNPGGTQ